LRQDIKKGMSQLLLAEEHHRKMRKGLREKLHERRGCHMQVSNYTSSLTELRFKQGE